MHAYVHARVKEREEKRVVRDKGEESGNGRDGGGEERIGHNFFCLCANKRARDREGKD